MSSIHQKALERISSVTSEELGEQAHGLGGLDWKSLLLELGKMLLGQCFSQGSSGNQMHRTATVIEERRLGWRIARNRIERQVREEFSARFGPGGFDDKDVQSATVILVRSAHRSQPSELQQFAAAPMPQEGQTFVVNDPSSEEMPSPKASNGKKRK